MKKKDIASFAKPIPGIIHKFAVQQKYKLMGSNSFRGLLYPSDIDIISEITEPADALANHFIQLFSEELPFIFVDFKAGTDQSKADNKMRWNPTQLKNGKNKGKKLVDAIKEDMLIKLDFVIAIGSTFAEVSEIYETKYQSKSTKKQIEDELEADVGEYAPNNSMKALKRFYSLLQLQNKYKHIQSKLVAFFNSEYGLLNKVANDLELLKSILPYIKVEQVNANLQMLKQKLATSSMPNQKKILMLNNKSNITKVIKYIRNLINPKAKELLQSFAKNM
jgi:hypothetical protein